MVIAIISTFGVDIGEDAFDEYLIILGIVCTYIFIKKIRKRG
jgi:hypothetical protein|tara:strand:+ start:485 stop:610 length:126 start_codon:yes stop_codon:yes gene_type:complete